MISDLLEENTDLRKRNAELEGKISVLLSCKNCPENKGGYICQKEYEGKCLTQKIQYIKELQEEIAELRNNGFTVSAITEQQLKVALEKGEQLEKENAELSDQLIKAKDLLVRLSSCLESHSNNNFEYELIKQVEQFISEVEK